RASPVIPTRRLVALAFAGVGLLVATGGHPLAVRMAFLADLALVLSALLDAASARRARLEIARLPHGKLNLGAPNAIQVRVRNLDRVRARVRVRDEAPPELASEGEEAELWVEGFREATHRYRVTPPR